ncbi:hypothetical protein [Streptosporangium sp. NBC_01469]|uniref:hypothetical protein n=1 Tax=Streptosporangium sp. NBC_01469 TaxID=2903898 RepID=UPI002E2CF97B|nr:hypothetical protein [Streptosporangium sp. NBC_01469]
MSTVQLPFEWAVGGKLPGSGDDYRILACSQGLLSRDDFEEIRTVYTIGTPETLPQVMIAWVGSGDDAHLVLAIQTWSDEEDRRHRKIARTRYFCVPYARIAQSPRPVSYEDLYHALKGCPLPMDGQLVVHVPMLDSGAVAAKVNGMAMNTAALLMTGQHVCVLGGEAVPMVERLRFLDTVAALLPYGMRARLAVSTWASSTAEHKIRLAFTQHVPARTYPITWGQPAEIPAHEEDAYRYLALLGRHDPDAKLVDWLAARTEPLTFGRNGKSRALDLLRGFNPSSVPALMPPPTSARPLAQESLEGLLTECADVLERGGTAEIRDVLGRLDAIVTSRGQLISDDERARYQKIIRDRRLLLPKDGLPEELETLLHEVVRMAGHGVAATPAQPGQTTREVVQPARVSATAIVRHPPPDPVASMKAAYQRGREELEATLRPLQTRELVAMAARRPPDMRVVQIVRDELVRRGGGRDEDPEIAEALREYGYLTDVIGALHPAGDRAQFDVLRDLLRAAYGPELHPKEFEEVFLSSGGRSGVLAAAAVTLFGVGAGEAVKKSVINLVRGSGLDHEIVERVERLLLESESGVSHLTSAEPSGRRWFGGRHRNRRDRPLIPPLTMYFLTIIFVIIALVEFFLLLALKP